MEANSNFPPDGSTSGWPPAGIFSNPENHLNHHLQIGNPMSENNGFLSTNQPGNQSYPNNIGSNEHMDPRSLHLMEAQLQKLRIDNEVRGQHIGNNANQQTLAGPSGIGTSHVHDPYSGGILSMGQGYNNVTSLESLKGMVVSMSREELGSQFLVSRLDQRNLGEIKFVLLEMSNDLHELMMDHYGNRVVQKLFDVVNVTEMTCLVDLIVLNTPKFQTVCNHCIGTRAIQKMLDHLTTQKQVDHFTRGLKIIVVPLATSQYGGYVIQHFLKLKKFFPFPYSMAIMDAMANACIPIATDKVGCSVIQRCLSTAATQASLFLIDAVISHALFLSQDLYGNYVVQYIIKLKTPTLNARIVNELCGKFVDLSTDKYASNVVEVLLRFSPPYNVAIIVQEIMNSPSFLYLLQDSYGNYVAQRAFKSSTGALRYALLNKILQHYTILCSDPFGQRVLASIHNFFK